MAYGLSRVQFLNGGMDFTKLPRFLLYIRCIEPDRKSFCHHLYALVHNLIEHNPGGNLAATT